MTVKEALQHDWAIGEKIWIVIHEYNSKITTRNGLFRSEKPIGIIEAKVSKIDRHNEYKESYEYIAVDFKGKHMAKEIPYIDLKLAAMVTHESYGEVYDHAEFCTNKFFSKDAAEKRFKSEVSSWNKKVEKFKKDQAEKLKKNQKAIEQHQKAIKQLEKTMSEDFESLKI